MNNKRNKKIDLIFDQVSQSSVDPMENPVCIRRSIEDAVNKGIPIVLFDWECPPRFLDKTHNGDTFVNYDVDLLDIFRGQKRDEFTELPKVVEFGPSERKQLAFLKKLGIPMKFYKIVADTNAYYITPQTLGFLDQAVINGKFFEFQGLLEKATRDYPVPTEIVRCSHLIEKTGDVYQRAFDRALALLDDFPVSLISEEVFRQQCERMSHHVGFQDKTQIEDSSRRTIATYAAEGMLFAELQKRNDFGNGIWLNNYEANQRTIAITNCLRSRDGLDPLSMLFLKKIV